MIKIPLHEGNHQILFVLLFQVDYNLYGMSHIHMSKIKFRPPLPDSFVPKSSYKETYDVKVIYIYFSSHHAVSYYKSIYHSFAFSLNDLILNLYD